MPCMLKSFFSVPQVFTRKTSCRLLHTNHSFHTYNLVKELELRGFARGQAVAIMKCIQAMLLDSSALIQSQMLSKSDLENATALSELRTEIQILHKNDWSALRLETTSIQRELDVLNSKIKEDTTTLKHEIQMDFNTRKAETRTDQKRLEIKIEELNNKYTIALGDIRTDIEAVKWDTTRRGMIAIFGMGICAIFVNFLISEQKSNESKQEPFSS
ncbi:9642_t:CDS:2, partial [Ambispora gerdemannii]